MKKSEKLLALINKLNSLLEEHDLCLNKEINAIQQNALVNDESKIIDLCKSTYLIEEKLRDVKDEIFKELINREYDVLYNKKTYASTSNYFNEPFVLEAVIVVQSLIDYYEILGLSSWINNEVITRILKLSDGSINNLKKIILDAKADIRYLK